MKKRITTLFLTAIVAVAAAQSIVTPPLYSDDYTGPLNSEVTYSTLYPNYYVELDRDTINEWYRLYVAPKLSEWRPVVIGFGTANGGNGINISANPILQVRVQVPDTVPNNSNLKLAFYISDGSTLGEYDPVSGEDYLEQGITPGSDVTFTYDWTNAKEVTNWGVWPPATGNAPDLTSIKSIGFSINTDSEDTGTYYIKYIEFGGGVLSLQEEAALKNNISVYPVPAQQMLSISESVKEARLTDLIGNVLIEAKDVETLDVSALVPGYYILITDKGSANVLVE